jgi:hypothetical protein
LLLGFLPESLGLAGGVSLLTESTMAAEIPKKFWAAGILLGEFICWYCAQKVDPTKPHDCPDMDDERAGPLNGLAPND